MSTAPDLHSSRVEAVERAHPGRTAGVVLGAVGVLLLLAVALGALVATAVDLVGWGMQG